MERNLACLRTGKAAKATGMIWGAAGAGAVGSSSVAGARPGVGAEISQGLFSSPGVPKASGAAWFGSGSSPGVAGEMSQGLVSLGSGGGVGGLGRLDGGT